MKESLYFIVSEVKPYQRVLSRGMACNCFMLWKDHSNCFWKKNHMEQKWGPRQVGRLQKGSRWVIIVVWTSIGAVWIAHTHHSIFLCWTTDGRLGNFQLGVIASSVPMHILRPVIWGTAICIEYVSKSGITMLKSIADTSTNVNCITCYLDTPELIYWKHMCLSTAGRLCGCGCIVDPHEPKVSEK